MLKTTKIFPNCTILPELSPFFNAKLGRRILVSDNYHPRRYCNKHDSISVLTAAQNFHTLASKSQLNTTQLTFIYVHTRSTSMLIDTLKEYEFPVLQQISIVIIQRRNETDTENNKDFREIPTFPERKSLRSLDFFVKVAGNRTVPNPMDVAKLQSLFQGLINSSPKLERIKISDDFYPDLENCGKLKSLKFDGYVTNKFQPLVRMGRENEIFLKSNGPKGFDLMELNRMLLVQVKGSLEELELGYVWHSRRPNMPNLALEKPLQIPPLPKLFRLVVEGLEYFTNVATSLNPKTLPNLNHITLSNCCLHDDNPIVEDALAAMPGPHRGIQSLNLTLRSVFNHRIMSRLGYKFPSLKYLDLTIISYGGNEMDSLTERILSFNNWTLEQVKLTFKFFRSSSIPVIHGFQDLIKFNAKRKVIMLDEIASRTPFTEMSQITEDNLIASKAFTSLAFKNFEFRIPELEIIMALRENHGLSLSFKNCKCLRDGASWVTTLQIPLDILFDF